MWTLGTGSDLPGGSAQLKIPTWRSPSSRASGPSARVKELTTYDGQTVFLNSYHTNHIFMDPELSSALEAYRLKRRHFNPTRYVEAKAALINAYFRQNGLRGCVVGLSGGVDSAITLGILAHAARQTGSPISRILALLLPMHGEGATNQDLASSRATEVAAKFNVECKTIDLSSTRDAATEASRLNTGVKGTAWATGQLVSYLRTPMLYYQSALLTEQGFRAVVCGTTNRDEGSYIGFFGKASDGMVDIQPISDIHKSEVYQVAKELDVPISVRDAVPTGDTYDGACDEEMIGAPYNALELYTWFLCADVKERESWYTALSTNAQAQFKSWTEKLERLHRINSHKYIGDSPAVHLDLHARAVPGGWRAQVLELKSENFYDAARLREGAQDSRIGPVELSSDVDRALQRNIANATVSKSLADLGDSVVVMTQGLNAETCDTFLRDRDTWNWVPADRHGRVISPANETKPRIGSYRATAYDEDIANLLWDRIAPSLPAIRTMNDFTPTDWNGYPVWRPVGINPMLRFIRYEKGGALVPHYDAGFDYKDGKRHTLMSVVITLTTTQSEPGMGGRTRFMVDHQRYLPLNERKYEDHSDLGRENDVLAEVKTDQGDVLIFDHRILHDGSMWNGTGSRIILRTDVIFERCAPHVLSIPKSVSPQLPLTKWARDPFFRTAYALLEDEAALDEAGYFEDGLQDDPSLDPRFWSAPYNKILKALSSPEAQDPSKELFVLVTTGAFCPVHAGHLEMMEKAKSALEARGHAVLGGYLAPDHDSYVSGKCGSDTLSAPFRLDLCERAVEDSDWLMVERWGALHVQAAVNFTAIIERLQKYLAYYIRTHRTIHVAFVFGSDNARFTKAFVGRGNTVCVLRPGYESELERVASHSAVINNPRLLFCREKTQPLSSSLVRAGNIQELPEKVRTQWTHLQSEKLRATTSLDNTQYMSLYVRYEDNWAVQNWAGLPLVDAVILKVAYERFLGSLIESLNTSFPNTTAEGISQVKLDLLYLQEQKLVLEKLSRTNAVISLDPCLPAMENLAVSRCFEPLSPTLSSFAARPGANPLATQIQKLEAKSYILFDDDTFSGATSKYVQQLIAETTSAKAKISRFITLCDADGPVTPADNLDLGEQQVGERQLAKYPPRLNHVDCRDFLIGARESGLVLKLPDGTLGRAPYILPYVRPHYHVSVPVDKEIDFSAKIWKSNRTFFSNVADGTLRLRDCDAAARRLFESIGFDPDTKLVDFCEWHISKLE